MAELIANLQVVQALCMNRLSPLLLEVVASGFAMSNSIGCIDAMVVVDVVVQTCLRIEEVEVAVQVVDDLPVIVPIACTSVHSVVDVTILQVNIRAQALHKLPVHFRIDVCVCLSGIVVVVLMVWL